MNVMKTQGTRIPDHHFFFAQIFSLMTLSSCLEMVVQQLSVGSLHCLRGERKVGPVSTCRKQAQHAFIRQRCYRDVEVRDQQPLKI